MDIVNNDARRDKLTADMFGSQQYWVLYLDWLDGLVVQAKARGFTEEQARDIVAGMASSRSAKSDPDT